jgi:fido (protein-threonine AMPylation protein)
MERFVRWFNDTGLGYERDKKGAGTGSNSAPLFVCIHPFEDGNCRIGRAIAEKAVSQGIGQPVHISLSKTIEANKETVS